MIHDSRLRDHVPIRYQLDVPSPTKIKAPPHATWDHDLLAECIQDGKKRFEFFTQLESAFVFANILGKTPSPLQQSALLSGPQWSGARALFANFSMAVLLASLRPRSRSPFLAVGSGYMRFAWLSEGGATPLLQS